MPLFNIFSKSIFYEVGTSELDIASLTARALAAGVDSRYDTTHFATHFDNASKLV